MEKLIWDETFSVGVEILDEQHKKLIKMLNAMIEAPGTDVGSELVSEVLTQMQQYATKHFSQEEEYMIKYGYMYYDQHKAEHKQYMKKMAMLCIETMRQRKAVPTEMLEFLKSWWVNHILKNDMQYKALFNSMGLK